MARSGTRPRRWGAVGNRVFRSPVRTGSNSSLTQYQAASVSASGAVYTGAVHSGVSPST